MEHIQLALDWTPNINHIGFFVALEKGFYDHDQLSVTLISPAKDDYKITPAKKVELGQSDFALCPMESVLSYRTKATPFDLKAYAAIYKEDLSAVVSLESSSISSPKDLDGKSYASYQARYEDEIVKQMIVNDGGAGDIAIVYPPKLGIWETIIEGGFDATWIFMNWEGVQAASKRVGLTTFKMSDFNIPYSYSPVLVASEKMVAEKREAYKAFVTASKKGFLYAVENREEAASILSKHVSKQDADIDIMKAIEVSKNYFRNTEDWGKMDADNVTDYLNWIYGNKLESKQVTPKELISNELL